MQEFEAMLKGLESHRDVGCKGAAVLEQIPGYRYAWTLSTACVLNATIAVLCEWSSGEKWAVSVADLICFITSQLHMSCCTEFAGIFGGCSYGKKLTSCCMEMTYGWTSKQGLQ